MFCILRNKFRSSISLGGSIQSGNRAQREGVAHRLWSPAKLSNSVNSIAAGSRFRYSELVRVVLPEMKQILLPLKVWLPRPAQTQNGKLKLL